MTCIDYTAAVNDRLQPATIHPLGISPGIPKPTNPCPLPMSHAHTTQRNSEMGGLYGCSWGSHYFLGGPWNFPKRNPWFCERLPSNLSSGARSAVAHIRLQGLPLAIGRSEGVDLWGPEISGGVDLVTPCKIRVPSQRLPGKSGGFFASDFFAIK